MDGHRDDTQGDWPCTYSLEEHNVSLLILYEYCDVLNQIQSLGIEVVRMPPGCTHLCQSVDIGFNKTMKCGMQEKWDNWMLEGEEIVDEAAKEPSWKLVSKWLVDASTSIAGQILWWKQGEWCWN